MTKPLANRWKLGPGARTSEHGKGRYAGSTGSTNSNLGLAVFDFESGPVRSRGLHFPCTPKLCSASKTTCPATFLNPATLTSRAQWTRPSLCIRGLRFRKRLESLMSFYMITYTKAQNPEILFAPSVADFRLFHGRLPLELPQTSRVSWALGVPF